MDIREATSRAASLKCQIQSKQTELRALRNELAQIEIFIKQYLDTRPEIKGFDDVLPRADLLPPPVAANPVPSNLFVATAPPNSAAAAGRRQAVPATANTRFVISRVQTMRLPPLNIELVKAAVTRYCADHNVRVDPNDIVSYIVQMRQNNRTPTTRITTARRKDTFQSVGGGDADDQRANDADEVNRHVADMLSPTEPSLRMPDLV